MRFAFVQAEKAAVPVVTFCRILQVSRSGFYAWCDRPESEHTKQDRQLRVRVRASFDASKQRYGSPRVWEDLVEDDMHVSRKRVVRLMQEEGLKARVRKRFKSTTMSDHDHPVAANLLNREFTAPAPNQRWVGDTTEFVIGSSGKLYLAAILDLFSRFVVGWAISAINDRHLTLRALEAALKRRCPDNGLLHHSDQGSPYASEDYQAMLEAQGPRSELVTEHSPRAAPTGLGHAGHRIRLSDDVHENGAMPGPAIASKRRLTGATAHSDAHRGGVEHEGR